MIIPPLQKLNRTSDNETIVPGQTNWVTSHNGSIQPVLRTGTFVLCQPASPTDHARQTAVTTSLASCWSPTLSSLHHA